MCMRSFRAGLFGLQTVTERHKLINFVNYTVLLTEWRQRHRPFEELTIINRRVCNTHLNRLNVANENRAS